MGSRCALELQLTGLTEGLDRECKEKREFKDDVKIWGLKTMQMMISFIDMWKIWQMPILEEKQTHAYFGQVDTKMEGKTGAGGVD